MATKVKNMKREHESMGGKRGSSSKGVGLTKKETGFSAKVGRTKSMSKEIASPACDANKAGIR